MVSGGVAGSQVIGRRRGAFSTLLRQSGLRASTGGVLATKSERKMLASTWLYSLYAWFEICVGISFFSLLFVPEHGDIQSWFEACGRPASNQL